MYFRHHKGLLHNSIIKKESLKCSVKEIIFSENRAAVRACEIFHTDIKMSHARTDP